MASGYIPVMVDSTSLAAGMKVIVFGVNYDIVTPDDINIAWNIFSTRSTVDLKYPKETCVGGYFYIDSDTKVTVPSSVAQPGTTWDYVTSSKDDYGSFAIDSKYNMHII